MKTAIFAIALLLFVSAFANEEVVSEDVGMSILP